MKRVLINKVRCKKCDDVIESTHSHDFKRCKCGTIFIDGGTEYQRYGRGMNQGEGEELGDYIDFSYSIYEDD